MDYSNVFVCVMGVGIVFGGLTCLVLLSSLMSRICYRLDASSGAERQEPAPQEIPDANAASAPDPICAPDTREAIITAVLAEEMGISIEAVSIKSIKKL